MLVSDWGGGQQLEDDGKEEVLPPLEVFSLLEETKTVNSNFDFKEKDPSTLEEGKTESHVFENNDGGKEAVPSSLDEGRTGKREERTSRIKSGILWNTPKWT